jgi:FG-GAP-like repeat/Abnormal spindle-like microcephaly-assoc'd, ASPM-SPD-2-Hydin
MKTNHRSHILRIPIALGVLTCSLLLLAAKTDKPSAVNFLPAVLYSTNGYEPIAIAVADVNGDSKPDVIVANGCTDHTCTDNSVVSVMLGDGNGTFQAPISYASGGAYATNVTVADVNGDGKPDLLVTNDCAGTTCVGATTGSVAVLLGNGDGTFQTPVPYSTVGYDPVSVSVGDVNGDGKVDLVVSNDCISSSQCNPGSIAVLLGNGDGTFQVPTTTYQTGGFHADLATLADVNGDGKLDVLVAVAFDSTETFGEVGVLLGNGDGTFQPSVLYPTGGAAAYDVAVADINGDGKPDMVVSNTYRKNSNVSETVVGVLLGNGDGTFQTATTYGTGGVQALQLVLKDINGDGKLDVVVTNECNDSRPINCNIGQIGTLLGNGDGTFQTAVPYPAGDAGTVSVAVADVNHDGKLDIIAGNNCNPVTNTNCLTDIGVLLGTGAGVQFTPGNINFGSHAVGTTSGTRIATLTNASGATLTITSIGIAGTDPGDFSVASSACGGSLAVGSSCTISVKFTPAATGARSGLLEVKDNGAGSPQKVRLTGTGT